MTSWWWCKWWRCNRSSRPTLSSRPQLPPQPCHPERSTRSSESEIRAKSRDLVLCWACDIRHPTSNLRRCTFTLQPTGKYQDGKGFPQFKRYLSGGVPIQDVTDIFPISSQAQERLGYPTQKPEALLERIISASSNEGEIVLDPFCGCGTAIAVAQRLNRRWIGIDITHLAIGLIKKRLDDAFGEEVRKTYEVIGEPVDLAGAQKLADEDKFQFQSWALSLVGARQAGGVKRGADRGIDGRLIFYDETKAGRKEKQIIFSVKGGGVQVKDVRDLRGVIERETAEIGVLISMEPPTKPMLKEAIEAGFYQPPGLVDKYPRIQILSIAELLEGKRVEYPRLLDITYKKAPRARRAVEEQIPLVGPKVEDEGPF